MCNQNEETKQTVAERKSEDGTVVQSVKAVSSMLTRACSSFVKWFMIFICEYAPVISNLFNASMRAFNAVARQKKRNRDRNQRRRNKNHQIAPVRELFRICSHNNNADLHPRGSKLIVAK